MRKTLLADGTVLHGMDEPGNWDASVEIRKQAKDDERNLWSALPGTPYIGDWNNFKKDNSDDITELFELFGFDIADYHNATSYCANKQH